MGHSCVGAYHNFDVAKEIGGDQHIEVLWRLRQTQGSRIYQQFFHFQSRERGRDLQPNATEETARLAQDIRLMHQR